MYKKRRLLSLVLVLLLIAGTLMGCKTKQTTTPDAPKPTAAAQPSPSAAQPSPTKEAPYKLSIWMPFLHSAFMKSYAEVEVCNEIAKRVNVELQWVHPPVGQETENFNVLMASASYPDAMYYRWTDYPGGLTKAIQDKVVIPLDKYMDKDLPNLKKVFEKYPEIKKQALLDNNSLPFLPAAANDLRRRAFDGYLVRGDWMDKLSLKAPNTVQDFYNMLKTFKNGDPNGNGKADEIPLGTDKNAGYLKSLATAWGTRDGFQLDPNTGKVAFGPVMPQFKDYLIEMNKWYKEGLIDNEFASIDSKVVDSRITGNIYGTFRGNTASFEKYTKLVKPNIPNVKFVGLPFPTGPLGKPYAYDENRVRLVWGQGVVITSNCKNVPAALRFFDYGYSDEGYIMYGWGIKDKSYKVENGQYKLTDIITNDPNKLPTTSAIVRFAFGNNGFAKVHNFDFWRATELNNQESVDANELWFKSDNSLLLPLLNLTDAESKELANIMTEVNTYLSEKYLKFIMGVEPISNFDKFVDTINKMKIDRAVQIEQAAYDRYLAKK